MATKYVMIRDYYMTFSISALVLARDSSYHMKPDSEAGVGGGGGGYGSMVDTRDDMENFMS